MKRRELLKLLLSLLGITAVGSFVYPLARFLGPAAATKKVKQVSLKKSEIAVGEAKELAIDSTPVLVINRPGAGFIAVSRVCTHLGCLVDFNKAQGRIICPCHGAVFDLDGKVLSGPPPKPLPKIPLRVEGDSIRIG
jgi:cytochrome b6-f complex iron-sulfur subunit